VNEESNDAIGRYVYHVGRHLPAERREDVARELVSLIGERVEDELGAGESREAVVLRVLREMGPPSAVAARYGYERRLLIGPSSLPAFFKLVKVIPLAVLALSLFAIPYVWSDGFTLSALGEWLLAYLNSMLLNLGVLVVVFIVLEQFSRMRTKPERVFDPSKLTPPPAPLAGGKVRPGLLVAEIYAAVAVLVLGNFYPHLIGVWTDAGLPRLQVVPLSAVGVHLPLWLLNVWLAGSIVLRTEVLRQGTWTRESRWGQVALSGLGLVIVVAALISSHLGHLDAELLASMRLSASDPRAEALSRASRALVLAAGPLVLLIVANIARNVWRLLRAPGAAA
jgi:hypothetical protein